MSQKLLLLAGMLLLSAGCRSVERCEPRAQAQPQPLPFSYSHVMNNDKGQYFKETYTREAGNHDKSRTHLTGGNNVGQPQGEYCPPGGTVIGGQTSDPVIITGQGQPIPGNPGGNPPSKLPGTTPVPTIPVPPGR